MQKTKSEAVRYFENARFCENEGRECRILCRFNL